MVNIHKYMLPQNIVIIKAQVSHCQEYNIFLNTPYYPWYDSTTSSSYISINQSINSIKVHHATEALGHNMVQNSTMTT